MAPPIGDALSREAACLGPRGNHDATIDSQKIRWNCRVSRSSIEPGGASAPYNPLAPPMGRSYCFAKSRNIWATARFVKWVATAFFYDDEIGLKSVYLITATTMTM